MNSIQMPEAAMQTRRQKLVSLGSLMANFFIVSLQGYFIFAKLIPQSLSIYSSTPAIQAHVEKSLHAISDMWIVAAALAMMNPAARLFGIYIRQAKINNCSAKSQ